MNTLVIALIIFLVTYLFIITEWIPASTAAFLGGIAMVGTRVLTQEEAFHSIDLGVIFLLTGMMMIVFVMSETGVFQWVAIKIAQLVKGEPFALMAVLSIVTAVFSAFLDNVTTVLLIAPVSILLAEQLELDAVPFLITEAIASNIGGTATLIGDPPNILIGTAAHISFNDFLIQLGPVILLNLVFLVITLWFLFGKNMHVSRDLKAKIMELDSSRAIKDKKMLKFSLVVMGLVILGFLTHPFTGLEPAVIAMTGGIILIVLSGKHPEEIYKEAEWDTLFFFMGLFMLVDGVVKVGLLKIMADRALALTGGDLGVTSMLILWLSGIASAVVNNIPYTATMIPMIKEIIPQIAAHSTVPLKDIGYALWWALALGACLGGNGTLVGASANVVAAGIATKSGKPISFMRFTKYGAIITLESLVVSSVYILIRYIK
ncbi:ArsB/NhaD family transporter [Haliovirga abyssi]|uniref:Membrane protein n=1 Tax=Haliovirga abyssi TaxID=2996794 RepID=A0AAU9E013_9FUSO|nr:ArsB/NhaD family transporter [Haliovirga abyssi]BDU49620.1 membrane protein [Haliovirga abyssi]